MKAVIETATGKALYLFGDGETVTVTDTGMTSPVTALDIRSATHSVVTTTAPSFFVGGGVMRWDDAWEILDQEAYDAAYAAAQPIEQPRYPLLFAAGTITFEDGEVTSITGNWNWKISACFRADVGVYYVFFTEPLPDDDYMAKAWDGGKSCFISKDEQFPDYFIITVKDLAGDPSDASTISVEVIRAS
ncbi:hypothetical protein ASD54_12275 [Rhizobium sp. Root149]|uniref:hypothetical protein n=1 Tax=Rhizobium sp. Root149 TaxID=1736473 RepID=UPI000713ABED|nr:hypothetical protein [Rhizobium sp. Root149]KQZ49708.1 hypothetical protein ASD54_12275 [Rhizobium sp. Root149]